MAGAVELATAYIALVPSLKGASQSISSQMTPASAAAGAEGGASLGGALLAGVKKFALPVAGIVAAFSVGKLVKDSVKDFQDYQGAVNGFGRIAGGSTQQFSGLREAIKLSGVDVDAAQGGLTIFSKNLGNASQDGAKASAMAKKLGTDFLDASGNVKPMSDIMPGLADKFKAMPDGAEKTALAMQLFGRSGAQMLPFLNQGSEGIAKLTTQAGKMGLILDDADKKIFAASKAGIREYQESVKGLHVAIGSTVLPVLTAFGNVGRSITVPAIQALAGAMQAARGPAMALAGHIQALADRMRMGVEGVITLLTKGQFTGGLSKALGIEEDSKIVGVVLGIRDGFIGAFGAIKSAVGGIDLGAIFGGLKPVFEPVVALFHQLAPVIAPLIPQLMSLYSSLSLPSLLFKSLLPILPQIGSALGQLASALGGMLASALTTVVPVLAQLVSMLVGSLGQAIQSVLPAIVGLIPMVVQVFSQLVPVILSLLTAITPLIGIALPPLAALFGALIPVVVQLVTSVLPVAVQIITMLVQAFVPLVTILAAMLIPIIQALMPVVMTVFGVIAQVITSVMQIVQGVIQVVLGIISGNWAQVWEGIVNIFSGVWNTIVAVVGGAIGIVWGLISAGFSVWLGFISGALGSIGSFFADTWNNVLGGVGGFVGGLLGFFSGLPGQILGTIGNLGGLLVSAGQALIQGFIDGIKGMVGAIGDAVGGVMDFAKQFFPHSPAKRGPFSGSGYTSFSGQALARDFAKGIASQNDVVADAAAGIMTSASLTGSVGISSALSNSNANSGPNPIYVQNPFTGEYLLSKVDSRVGAGIGAANQDAYRRPAR